MVLGYILIQLWVFINLVILQLLRRPFFPVRHFVVIVRLSLKSECCPHSFWGRPNLASCVCVGRGHVYESHTQSVRSWRMSAFNTARGRGGDFGLPSLQDLGNLPLTLIFCNVAWLGWYWLVLAGSAHREKVLRILYWPPQCGRGVAHCVCSKLWFWARSLNLLILLTIVDLGSGLFFGGTWWHMLEACWQYRPVSSPRKANCNTIFLVQKNMSYFQCSLWPSLWALVS